ncbi:trigger factor [Anaerolentibacter hominis]|uniref:trigger factor n=1 Tax=Anaerolentibacter hominis TaxID=3079009 RepID=UPI0031B886A7
MKKIVTVLAVMICATVVLTGCGKKENTDDASGKVVLENDYITIGEYKGLNYTPEDIAITEEDYNNELAAVLESYGTTRKVTDRGVQEGDTIVLDFEGSFQGEAMDAATAVDYELEVGNSGFIPGFDEALIDRKIGKEFEFTVKFPDPYENDTKLSGQDVTFKCTVKSIEELVAAQLTDEFVKENFDEPDVNSFKDSLKESLIDAAKEKATNTDKEAVWSQVIASASVKQYPEDKMTAYKEEITTYYKSMADYYGMEFADFLSSQMSMDEETFNQQAQAYAESLCMEDLVVNLISETENLALTDEDMAAGYARFEEDYGMAEEEVNEYFGTEDAFRTELLYEKVVNFVLENAVSA